MNLSKMQRCYIHPEDVLETNKHTDFIPRSFPKSEWCKCSISYQGPRHWESLPVRLKLIPDFKSFKDEVKDYLTKEFYSEGFV